jgi:outer membrane protein assembly factor BamD (BamD/ComL family)
MSGAGGLETEAHLLQRAKDALSGSPAAALALAEEHAARFPAGALAQEREVLIIQALARLGRAEAAHARARRFLDAYPGSVHRTLVEAQLRP